MVDKNIGKILILLIIVVILLPGAGALDNMTVIERFPDGQPRHVTYTRVVPNPGSSAPTEQVEGWYNEYGQIVVASYLDRELPDGTPYDRKVSVMPQTKEELLASTYPIDMFYVDENGVVVNYKSAYGSSVSAWIASNKTPLTAIQYPPGYGPYEIMQEFNMTKADIIDVKNYEFLKSEAYNHSPAYQTKRIKEIESKEIPEIKGTITALNETVARQGTLLGRVLSWINQTFSVDLR